MILSNIFFGIGRWTPWQYLFTDSITSEHPEPGDYNLLKEDTFAILLENTGKILLEAGN